MHAGLLEQWIETTFQVVSILIGYASALQFKEDEMNLRKIIGYLLIVLKWIIKLPFRLLRRSYRNFLQMVDCACSITRP